MCRMLMKPNSSSSLSVWLEYLEMRHQQPINLGLTRVRAMAELLDILAWDSVVITVAGTNGKGSTIAALDAIYTAAGFCVATYTSPHLLVFNERIHVNQQPISDADLIRAFTLISEAPESDALTYFEMVTLAAFWYFKRTSPDVVLLEVGMGGRLDATNCVDSDLAIVTTVDLDHEAWLGNTREAIAFEKAGIFRANKPAIYADTHPPATLIDVASAHNTKLLTYGEAYTFKLNPEKFIWVVQDQNLELELPLPQLNPHAFAAACMATYELRQALPVLTQHYAHAAKQVMIAGRQQWLNTPVPIIVDVAHNPQAVSLLAMKLKKHAIKGRVHAIFSGLNDKNLDGLMEPMRALVDVWYLTCLDGERGTDASRLKLTYERVMKQPASGVFEEPKKAYLAATCAAKLGDVIIVYGSFLLVSALMLTCLNKGDKGELKN
jgi:dihydrofolate synthase / folylpolyglutamate synthase